MKTGGLIGAITKIMDRRNKNKKYSEKEMQAIIARLQIEDPTTKKKEDGRWPSSCEIKVY